MAGVRNSPAVWLCACFCVLLALAGTRLQGQNSAQSAVPQALPPRVAAAQRFLARRSWPWHPQSTLTRRPAAAQLSVQPSNASAGTASWQSLGPAAVSSLRYGLVTGRISSIAFDPADATGNRLFVGTTGGGVWFSTNASTSAASNIVFSPMTDSLAAISTAHDASISIGALSVQPGGTGVVLAGTGDPNDALDSYYGAGILRSTDGGTTWSLRATTADQKFAFIGEGFAGFAWSTLDPKVVVAAVSQAYEGALVDAERPDTSYEGLYYSTDSGDSWSLARIVDGSTAVQGPLDSFATPHGNAATAVVWNPVRHVFIAAVRYHGYYQSSDGVTWTRLASQPGANLTTALCPANPGSIGSTACPIFRGALAVNPTTGDTFAWTVDVDNQDQGIWQDACGLSSGSCLNQSIAFGTQWNSAALESSTTQGAATIPFGDYTLALAAIPAGQDTMLLAGDADLWKCNLATGCTWRNTTNAYTCAGAQVAPFQHALGWNAANPLEIFAGNDSGLWRSVDAMAESGSVCSSSDAAHFDNLNGSFGSLAEPESVAQSPATPYTLLAGLGVNGTAGVKGTSGPTSTWPEILSGEGGPVVIDPANADNWYVNNSAGVSIHQCVQSGNCSQADFGTTPVVGQADVSDDGYAMVTPAAFLVDPLDTTQLLVATCRIWRGPASGGWTSANAISGFMNGVTGKSYCNGDALVRTLAAMPIAGGSEVVYAGMFGSADGGATRAGHIYRAVYTPGGAAPAWQDLTFNTVSNDTLAFNAYELDITGIAIDPHDATGNTIYVTVAGIPNPTQAITTVYVSRDGGAQWASIASDLPYSPANAVVVDPQDANTVYVATDAGVYSTRQIADCTYGPSNCWSQFGTGLPNAPAVTLSASPAGSALSVLVAGTYGRGIWQIPLWTSGIQLTAATVNPTALTFASQPYGTASAAQSITLTNTGGLALTPTAVTATGDFTKTDNCENASIGVGASCTIQVSFTPSRTGTRTGTLTIGANVAGGQLTVALSGAGTASSVVYASPTVVSFGQVQVGTTSSAFSATLHNTTSSAVAVTSVAASTPFQVTGNTCGSSLASNGSCQLAVTFTPTQQGAASGALSIVDAAGTQTVALAGTGASAPTDALSPASLTFASTPVGQLSAAQDVTLTNSGDLSLDSLAVSVAGPFQATSGCGASLSGQTSCTVRVVYAPTQAGTQTGTLTITDSLRAQTVSLAGTAVTPATLSAAPSQLAFGTQQLGVASAAQTVTIANTGGSAAANIGFQISGANAGSFAAGSTTCGSVLAAGAACTVSIAFTPQLSGSNLATLTITSSTGGVSAVQVGLSGTGYSSAGINVSPARLSFTVAVVGQSSAAQTVTITNTGPLAAAGLTLTTASPFSLAQTTCGTSLAAGASCAAAVLFTPPSNGSFSGTLTAGSSTYSSAVVALVGQGGLAGSASLQPAMLNFATTGVGQSSDAQSVTVTNTGPVTLSGLVLGVSTGFQITGTTCATSLAAGASCVVHVAFAPTAAGAQSGALTVSSSALAASAETALAGMGFDFTLSALSPSSFTAASGQSTRYTLTVTPLNGSSGTFTFSCGTLPAHATCSFNPSSEAVPANSSLTFTLTVSTGIATAGLQAPPRAPAQEPPFALCLALLPFAYRRRRRSMLLPLAMLVFAVAGLAGCAAASGSTGTGGGGSQSSTPPGSYTIAVTATANGVSHTANVTLTVD